jgi:hypothetical protein
MHSRTIDTPPAELRKLVPKLTRQIEELERLRAEAAAALAALDEAHRVVKGAEEADRQAVADHARGRLKQEPKPSVPKARQAVALAGRGPLGLTRPPLTRRPISRPRLRSTARSTRRNSTTRASRAGRGAEGGNEAGRPRG